MICMARIFGAPLTVPAGNVARRFPSKRASIAIFEPRKKQDCPRYKKSQSAKLAERHVTMNNEDVKRTVSKPLVVGLVTLILGVLIGVAAEKYVGRSSALAGNGRSAHAASGSPTVGATQRSAPDAFDFDAIETWDPFREMRNLRAEMDEMFRRSIARFHMNPQMDLFKDDAGYSLSLDVRELK